MAIVYFVLRTPYWFPGKAADILVTLYGSSEGSNDPQWTLN
jgi:hypothetical protein